MADLIIVSIFVAFIALCVAYVGWCDRIIGDDELVPVESSQPPAAADVPATTTAVTA
ncbi:MAG: hypothetical protein HY828_00185 [Actinobacteria bacterium]|nr:hypothetical protein [Actinomycetota bacterium]